MKGLASFACERGPFATPSSMLRSSRPPAVSDLWLTMGTQMPAGAWHIRQASTAEVEAVIPEHFQRMWMDNGVPQEQIMEDAASLVNRFCQSHAESPLVAFVCVSDEGQVLGSTVCQPFAGLYPLIVRPEVRWVLLMCCTFSARPEVLANDRF